MENREYKVIAIDGPSGAGKSSIAKRIADIMGFQYLNTGSLYRAIGLRLSEAGFEGKEQEEEDIANILSSLSITYKEGYVYINGVDYSDSIKTTKAGHYASVFSALKVVRGFLLDIQRAFGRSMDIVAEGRDMTTVVFPKAWKKFYLDASLESRAKRRYLQMSEIGRPISFEEALQDVRDRDYRDRSRTLAPLKVAEDAKYIDTTDLSIEGVIQRMLPLLK